MESFIGTLSPIPAPDIGQYRVRDRNFGLVPPRGKAVRFRHRPIFWYRRAPVPKLSRVVPDFFLDFHFLSAILDQRVDDDGFIAVACRRCERPEPTQHTGMTGVPSQ